MTAVNGDLREDFVCNANGRTSVILKVSNVLRAALRKASSNGASSNLSKNNCGPGVPLDRKLQLWLHSAWQGQRWGRGHWEPSTLECLCVWTRAERAGINLDRRLFSWPWLSVYKLAPRLSVTPGIRWTSFSDCVYKIQKQKKKKKLESGDCTCQNTDDELAALKLDAGLTWLELFFSVLL